MDKKKIIRERLYKLGTWGYYLYWLFIKSFYLYRWLLSDKYITRKKYRSIYKKEPNLDNPQTLNEKILWLKLNDKRPILTEYADKYTARKIIKDKFGREFLIPLLYKTDNWKELTFDKIPNEPCIIKPSHTQGDMCIIRNKQNVNINKLRYDIRTWMVRNLYYETQEWQYKNCKPMLLIEKLLQTKDGYIPNDYKLHYINGKLEFVYCSVGRETINKRNIYNSNWEPYYFSWVGPSNNNTDVRGEEIPAPPTFELMKQMGAEIAKEFSYVRVDFYDVDGRLYFGEITFFHGGGFDVFVPSDYDKYFGEKLNLF